MKLYEIRHEITELLERGFDIDLDTGEVLDIAPKLDALQMDEREKLENIALYIKGLNAEAAAIREEERTLAERRRTKENRAERLHQYISAHMIVADIDALETARVKLTFRKSTATEIDADVFMKWAVIGGDYLKHSDPVPDKKLIADALKAGADIPGASLVERRNLQVK
jgi:hypothetical protein